MRASLKGGIVTLFVSLFAFWIILASRITWPQLVIGALASLLIVLYSLDLIFKNTEKSSFSWRLPLRFVWLCLILIKEVFKANIVVAKLVLSPKMRLNPTFKSIPQPLKKDFNRAFFGNAITLTPGTLTIDMDENEILVHGLLPENIDQIEKGPIQKAFRRLEGDLDD